MDYNKRVSDGEGDGEKGKPLKHAAVLRQVEINRWLAVWRLPVQPIAAVFLWSDG